MQLPKHLGCVKGFETESSGSNRVAWSAPDDPLILSEQLGRRNAATVAAPGNAPVQPPRGREVRTWTPTGNHSRIRKSSRHGV